MGVQLVIALAEQEKDRSPAKLFSAEQLIKLIYVGVFVKNQLLNSPHIIENFVFTESFVVTG